MQKAVIFGAGGMGVAIAYAMCRLGFEVQMVDPDKKNATQRIKKKNVQAALFADWDEIDVWSQPGNTGSPDIVISAAPYHQNHRIAKKCFERGWRYCDLGGDPHTSAKIAKLCKKQKGICMTDLGLAPGLVNIMAEAYFAKYSQVETVETAHMKVGGLPVKPNGKLNYGLTWSCDGLWNELTGYCDVLENGELSQKKALCECEDVVIDDGALLECFHTKGGIGSSIGSMMRKGVRNCSYKTLRYRGHCDLLKFLLEECQLGPKDFAKVMKAACPATCEDVVNIIVDINDHRHAISVVHDALWTAMQKATAFPAAACASIISSGTLDDKSVLCYEDVPIEDMRKNLLHLGFPDPFAIS